MKNLIRVIREYQIPSRGVAIILMVICRGIIWQTYSWLRSILSAYSLPALSWTVCSLYFASLLCLFLFLLNTGKRYPGMVTDALLGGCLLAVAAVLHDADVSSLLSRKGFGGSTWVTFLGACALIISKSANMSRIGRRSSEPPARDEGSLAE
jgi:hypothetical protein